MVGNPANRPPPLVDNSCLFGGGGNAFNKNTIKRFGNSYVCGEPGHFAREHKKATANDQTSSMNLNDREKVSRLIYVTVYVKNNKWLAT